MTKGDVAAALDLAASPSEVDAAAHLSLLLFDVAGCNHGFVERGRAWPSLHDLVARARARVGGYPDSWTAAAERHRQLDAAAAEQRRREARELREECRAQQDRIGLANASP